MSEKRLEIELERSNGRFEFMSEIVNKCMLEAIEMEGSEVEDEDNENSRQNKADQKGQNEDDDPSLSLEKLVWIELIALGN